MKGNTSVLNPDREVYVCICTFRSLIWTAQAFLRILSRLGHPSMVITALRSAAGRSISCSISLIAHYTSTNARFFRYLPVLLSLQFRRQVVDILKPEHDDYYLVRWLRGKRYTQSRGLGSRLEMRQSEAP